MLTRIVFERSELSPAISVLTGKANNLTGKLSPPVRSKLLGESLDPPGVVSGTAWTQAAVLTGKVVDQS